MNKFEPVKSVLSLEMEAKCQKQLPLCNFNYLLQTVIYFPDTQ